MGRTVFRSDDPEVNSYRLLTAVVVPRPIAWVSTLDAEGRGNLAPHSFFTVASARPPVVAFTSIGTKDTIRNVEATGEFVVNVASAAYLHAVNDSSAPFAYGDDEAAAVGLRMEPSELVTPPRVADSPASIECTLNQVVELGQSRMVLGDVVAITVRGDALVDGHPAMEHLQPLSRLGRNEWGLPPEVIALDRPRTVDDVR